MNPSSLVEQFLNHLEFEKKASPYTLKNYRHYLEKFLEFYKSKKLNAIDNLLIQEYIVFVKSQPLKKSTQNYFLIALRSFLSFLEEKGIESAKPNLIKLGSQKIASPKTIGKNALNELLSSIDLTAKDGYRDRVIIGLFIEAGLKVSELSLLNINQINLKSQSLSFTDKKGKARSYKLSPSLTQTLNSYLSSRGDQYRPLFIRYKGEVDSSDQGEKMRLSTRSIERMLEKYTKFVSSGVKATPLILRHSFANNLFTLGENLESVSRKLGHSSSSSTRIYKKTP
jgi:integrase/recombinase XerC